jgi:hypothetical protein
MSVGLKSKAQRLRSDAFRTARGERGEDSALGGNEKRRRASLAAAVQITASVSIDN